MKMVIEAKKRLFVAYPWDIYIQSVYEDIFKTLFRQWDIRHGSNVTLKDKDKSEVEKFLNRNKHLYDIFVKAIENSDFFIADVTGLNPNVMLELGIAIQLHKNVLIVSSDELKKLPFDISGFRVSQYKSKAELTKIIKDELNVYRKIKSQTFSNYFDECYFSFPSEGELKHGMFLPFPIRNNIKNLRLKVEYKFLNVSNSHDWFGIHLRLMQPNIFGSELVYSRSNGDLESVSFPGRRGPEKGKKISTPINSQPNDDFIKLELILEENTLKAINGNQELVDNHIQNENTGGIALHAYGHDQATIQNLAVRYRNLEIISLDTTTPIF